MTKINTTVMEAVFNEWIQMNQEQISKHPAWHKNVFEDKAEALLKGQSPFTYILRPGKGQRAYFISFVKDDLSIKHQFFALEPGRKGWLYRNGTIDNCPTEIVSRDINELIRLMMHCDVEVCRPLRELK